MMADIWTAERVFSQGIRTFRERVGVRPEPRLVEAPAWRRFTRVFPRAVASGTDADLGALAYLILLEEAKILALALKESCKSLN